MVQLAWMMAWLCLNLCYKLNLFQNPLIDPNCSVGSMLEARHMSVYASLLCFDPPSIWGQEGGFERGLLYFTVFATVITITFFALDFFKVSAACSRVEPVVITSSINKITLSFIKLR